MTDTLISLLSIFIGIISTNIFGVYHKKHSLGVVGNSIAGVFGSIFFIKIFSHFGISPIDIMATGDTNLFLLIINFIVAIIGGIVAVIFIKKLKIKFS